MRRLILVALLAAPLCGCDSASHARQALAKCEMDKRYTGTLHSLVFVDTCMQAAGFVLDSRLTNKAGAPCHGSPGIFEEPSCYRPDTWWDDWWTGMRIHPEKSN